MRTLDRTKQQIIDAGFSHIKLELEANLDRDEGYSDCYQCDEGRVNCSTCDGDGAVSEECYVGQRLVEQWSECDDCDGEGMMDCNYCDGRGTNNGTEFGDEDTCGEFIFDNVSPQAREALTYGNFYNDGSVDSEYTFTLPVEKAEYLTEYIEAFKKLADQIGNGMDVTGAGMHISVIPTEMNGRYPSSHTIERSKMQNFRTEVTKLLPALFFAASAGEQSRNLGYRYPRVSEDDKYSAIFTHYDTCLEYRLFETCYDKPETVFEYMQVIAKTLAYLNPEKKVPELKKEFIFEVSGMNINRFYKTPDQLRVLNETIKYVKPSTKTYAEMKKERGIVHNLTTLKKNIQRKEAQYREDYQQLVERIEERKKLPLTFEQQARKVTYLTEYGFSEQKADNLVRNIDEVPPVEQFIARHLFSTNSMTVTV